MPTTLPRAVLATHRAETLQFASGSSTLGTVVAATSARGLVAILLGEDPAALLEDLRSRLPGAHCEPASAGAPWFAAVLAAVDGGGRADLLLDPRGSPFQQRVWRGLRAIPAGTTRSYAQLANDLGLPTAVRAVAGACARNPLAVVVPCHRVVRGDGRLGGYRWGLARKAALLQRERTGAASAAAS
ncbi:MAG: methylated-DNA--[protein]-cysteine S-methyltransferase [Planctomycetes bacterium]|nr:methylated-DNA--[protein]-cysteine S-methyltransferase [Planctomycetota bacterium]